MRFPQRLEVIAGLTERRLRELIAERIETQAGERGTSSRLVQAITHAALAGGKRVRPFLVMETARLFDVPDDASIDAAAALECIHCYSLVHDDLPAMDNDELRRGQPTVWKAFDEWTAILAGDALLTLAFEVLAEQSAINPMKRLALISGLARASGAAGMVGGQAFDLEADKLGTPAIPTAAHIRHLQSLKTGALIRYAMEAGAILGGATQDEMNALDRYGKALGLAFQIADDLLDAEGDVATVGKAVAKDAAANKATLVSMMGIEEARAQLARAEETAISSLAIFGNRAATLIEAAHFVARRKN